MSSLRSLVRLGAARLAQAEVPSAEADARTLLAHVLGLDAAGLARAMVLGSHVVTAQERAGFEQLVDERARRVPLQHLTGVAHFRTLSLRVGPGVFVPRPETEQLVDLALAGLPEGGRVVDLCTGSAAIALSIKAERPDATVMGVELSPDAVAWATLNRDLLAAASSDVGSGTDVGSVEIVEADATTPPVEWPLNRRRVAPYPSSSGPLPAIERPHLAEWLGQCDVVTANPPYIPTGAVPLDPEVRDHDPEIALYGGSDDGLAIPLRIAMVAAMLLKPGGTLVMEHADTQGESLPAALLSNEDWAGATDHTDLAGKPRHTVAVRAAARRERHTARMLPVREDGRVLLLHGWSPDRPGEPFWFSVGGEVEPGEDARTTAMRELVEEVGIVVEPDAVVGPIDGPTIEFDWDGVRFVQHQRFFAVPVAQHVEVSLTGLDQLERDTIDGHGWFTPEELEATRQSGHPTLSAVLAQGISAVKA